MNFHIKLILLFAKKVLKPLNYFDEICLKCTIFVNNLLLPFHAFKQAMQSHKNLTNTRKASDQILDIFYISKMFTFFMICKKKLKNLLLEIICNFDKTSS